MAADGGPVLLVRAETSPEDIVGMHASAGILTSRGGMTSHAAVVARGLGKPCIVGAGDLDVDEHAGEVRVKGRQVFHEGDELSIDGTTGEVIAGALATRPSEVLRVLLDGAEPSPAVRAASPSSSSGPTPSAGCASAPTPTPRATRSVAGALGAEGIGLCRTEHMFFDDERIPWVRQMILADGRRDADRRPWPASCPCSRRTSRASSRPSTGLPITIRLLDPPLHEFLPHDEKALRGLAEQMGIDAAAVKARAEALAEANPCSACAAAGWGSPRPRSTRCRSRPSSAPPASAPGPATTCGPRSCMPLVGTEQEMIRLRRDDVPPSSSGC